MDLRPRWKKPNDHEWCRYEEHRYRSGFPFASASVTVTFSSVKWMRSDGRIAYFEPHVAVVNNISLDHKSPMSCASFSAVYRWVARIAVLNLDNAETGTVAELEAGP